MAEYRPFYGSARRFAHGRASQERVGSAGNQANPREATMTARLAALAATLVFGLQPALAGPVAFVPDPNGATSFVMPSGNVECVYTPAGGSTVYMPADGGPELACDRAEPTYLRFTLSASGPADVTGDVGDPSCCGGTNTFAYGTSWSMPPFICTAATSGLTCKRGAAGFTISKAHIETH
jgi:hypothetical protein